MWTPPPETFERIQEIKRKNATFIKKEEMVREVMGELFLNDVGTELKRLYQNVKKNFKYLLDSHGMTRHHFHREIENRFGLEFPRQVFTKQKASRLKSIFFASVIATYFGVSVFQMIFTDLSKDKI